MAEQHAVFIHSKEFDKNVYPESCPFNTGRAEMTRRILHSMGMLSGSDGIEYEAQSAERTELEAFHTPRYLSALERAARGHLDEEALHMGLGTADTPIFPALYQHSTLVAGATLTAARLISSGRTRIAFNPSGGLHHAHPERAGGFCYINDVVLGCMHLAKCGMKVLFLDLDAHHCDGVQSAFWKRRDVMTISLHQHPLTLFPGTGFEHEIGEERGTGFAVNVPLPPGVYDEAYVTAVREVVMPLIQAFNPDVIVLELGMDGLSGDPLTQMHLTNNAYADTVKSVMTFHKPLLAVGGGGYNLFNTARGWALMWSILCGASTDDEMAFGLGGVMLESTDWKAGLRDRAVVVQASRRQEVDRLVCGVITEIKRRVFPLHGL